MHGTANSIIKKLRRNFGDRAAILEAMSWLESHGAGADLVSLKVLNELERQSTDADQIIWCTRWLQQNPSDIRSDLVYGSNSHSQILLEQEKFAKETDAESGRGLRKLIHGAVNEQIASIVLKWLSVFPSEKYSALLWAALLELDANPETVKLATDWLSENRNDSAYDRVLSKLLRVDASAIVLKLTEELIASKQRDGAIEAVIAVLSMPIEPKLRGKAIEWCKLYLQGERSSYVASKLEQLVFDPEVADLLLDWCIRNSENKFVASTWASLLSKVPTEKVMQKAWEYLEPDSAQQDWDITFQAFLNAAVKTKTTIPEVALKEAWDIWEQGDLFLCSHIGALLQLDPNETVLQKLFLWVKANPDETETVSIILHPLIALRPSPEVFDFATSWLNSQKVLDYNVTFIICQMLEVAPNPALIDLSHKLLPTCVDGASEWFTLHNLICVTRDERAIQRAVQLVNIEGRLAFRQHLAFACGQLIVTLSERKIEGLEFTKAQWLRWHSTKYPKFAKLLN